MSEKIKRIGIYIDIPEEYDINLEKLMKIGFEKKLTVEYALSLLFSKEREEIIKELAIYKTKQVSDFLTKPKEKEKGE